MNIQIESSIIISSTNLHVFDISLTKEVSDLKDILKLALNYDEAFNVSSLRKKYLMKALHNESDIAVARPDFNSIELPVYSPALNSQDTDKNPIVCCIVTCKIKDTSEVYRAYFKDIDNEFISPILYCPFFYLEPEFDVRIPLTVINLIRVINKSCSILIDLPETNRAFTVELPALKEYCIQKELKSKCIKLDKERFYAQRELRSGRKLPELYRFYIESFKSKSESKSKGM